jgi:hypothetical protein
VSQDSSRWQDAYAEQLALASLPTPTTMCAVE